MAASQCTSASESGWTLYLQDHPTSLSPPQNFQTSANCKMSYGGSEEDLSMSMVSDASSGPPIHHQCSSSGSSANTKNTVQSGRKRNKASCLDDTASSTLQKKSTTFANMKPSMVLAHLSSQGFSTTKFKGTSALQKHFGFCKSMKPTSEGFGGCRRRKG